MRSSGGKVNVLLVEDDDTFGRLLADFLEHNGYQVTWTAESRKALGHIEAASVEIVITDYHLPDMDGPELIRAVKAVRETAVVGITGLGDCAEMQAAGALYCFEKPFSLTEFLAVLESLPTPLPKPLQ